LTDRAAPTRPRKPAIVAMVSAVADKTAARIIAAAKKQAKQRPKKRKGRLYRSKAENPYGNGFDRVGRVVDTISAMTRRGQLSERQARAAQRYRDAFDTITASLRGTLGKDGVMAGNGTGKTPSRPEMEAAADLNAAADLLGVLMRVILEEVVGIGRTIEDTASVLCAHGRRANRADRDFIGRSLREALDIMADKWWPQGRRNKGGVGGLGYLSFMADGARPHDTGAGTFERGRVIHATAKRIFENGA
jgi:soluble cytochrome b562